MRKEPALHRVEQVEIVKFDFAQFQKIQRRPWAQIGEEVDGECAQGGFDQHGHLIEKNLNFLQKVDEDSEYNTKEPD